MWTHHERVRCCLRVRQRVLRAARLERCRRAVGQQRGCQRGVLQRLRVPRRRLLEPPLAEQLAAALAVQPRRRLVRPAEPASVPALSPSSVVSRFFPQVGS
jgi:hypothetical protein